MIRNQDSLQRMIHDTLSLMCRNSLPHSAGVRIQGLIGITVDGEVFLVQFDESYGNDATINGHDKQQVVDDTASPSMVEPTESGSRKRRRIPETANVFSIAAEPSASAEADSDVILIEDEVNDNHVKLEFDQFCNSVNNDCNYDLMFKAEDGLVTAVDPSDVQYQTERVNRGRNTLLRNMLANESSYTSHQAEEWQSASVSYEETTVKTMQTSSIKPEQTVARPRIKQEYWSQPARQIVRRYRQRQQQQQALAAYSDAGDDDSLVVTRSLHECGYPDCGKQFHHKQHLLRHQTQKHGRRPKRIMCLQKVWVTPGDPMYSNG